MSRRAVLAILGSPRAGPQKRTIWESSRQPLPPTLARDRETALMKTMMLTLLLLAMSNAHADQPTFPLLQDGIHGQEYEAMAAGQLTDSFRGKAKNASARRAKRFWCDGAIRQPFRDAAGSLIPTLCY